MFAGDAQSYGQSYIATAQITTDHTPPTPTISHPPIPMTIEKEVCTEKEIIEHNHTFPISDRRTNHEMDPSPQTSKALPGGGLLSYDVARTFLEVEGGVSEVILDSAASHSIISLNFLTKLQQLSKGNLALKKFPRCG